MAAPRVYREGGAGVDQPTACSRSMGAFEMLERPDGKLSRAGAPRGAK